MGNCHLYKIECFHTLGKPESERLKVTALNLFHPTASPPSQKVGFFILRHSLRGGRKYFFGSIGVILYNSRKGVSEDEGAVFGRSGKNLS